MEFKNVKIVVYVPISHSDKIRKVLAEAQAGNIGNYDSCSFSTIGTGRFRPLLGSNPFIGEKGDIQEVKEERIETISSKENLKKIIEMIRKAHPYEEPAIDIFPLLN